MTKSRDLADNSQNTKPKVVDAKADLIVGTGSDVADRLAVGADGTVLTADSAEASGLKWAAVAAGGKVLQVVSMTTSTQTTTTSTSYVDCTNYTLSITPTSASSKILCIFNPQLGGGGVQTQIYMGFQIVRNSTAIMTTNNANCQGAASLGGGYTWQYIQSSFVFLDSPATTSAVTYKGQIQDSTGIGYSTHLNIVGTSSITLLEIGA